MKNKILSVMFCLFIGGFFLINIIVPDLELSYFERRRLEKLPDINLKNLFNGNVTSKFEKYALDHFVFRDELRGLKTYLELNLFNKKDNNDLYVDNGYIFKIEYPLNNKEVVGFTKKMNDLYEKYLKGMNVYYSIIPDKNYYNDTDHLRLDYNEMIRIINNGMNSNIKYIDITDCLELEDYYYTDIHWRQEKLSKVVDRLSISMGFQVGSGYKEVSYKPFYGSYYGQLALKMDADELIYLENETIKNAFVNDIDKSGLENMYEVSSLGMMDSYDVYLSGATPIIEINNNMMSEGKELIIFRDSFGSSLAPLLIDGYKKITLVDIRYINSSLISNYIEFSNQDVLMMYNTTIINGSSILK